MAGRMASAILNVTLVEDGSSDQATSGSRVPAHYKLDRAKPGNSNGVTRRSTTSLGGAADMWPAGKMLGGEARSTE